MTSSLECWKVINCLFVMFDIRAKCSQILKLRGGIPDSKVKSMYESKVTPMKIFHVKHWYLCSTHVIPCMSTNTDQMTLHVLTELSLISLHWFLTVFASVVHMKVLLRIWDLFFYEGSTVLFQITMGMLKMKVCSPEWYSFTTNKVPLQMIALTSTYYLHVINVNQLRCVFNIWS